MMSVLRWALPRITTLNDLIKKEFEFLWVPREYIALNTVPKLPYDSDPGQLKLMMEVEIGKSTIFIQEEI